MFKRCQSFILASAFLIGGVGHLWGVEALPASSTATLVTSTSTTVTRLFAVYSGRSTRRSHYVPSGYMGDPLTMSGAYIPTHDGTGTALRINYRPKGPKGWAGVYWQQPANNWGDRPGQAGYDLSGASRLVFWARAEKEGVKIREVKVGGITGGRFPDSDVATAGPITLSKEWKRYDIDLAGKDLRHIIGGFGFIVNKFDNSGAVSFYLDDIAFEMPQKSALPAVSSTVTESSPVAKAPAMKEPPAHSKDIHIKSDGSGLRMSFSSQFLFPVGKTVLRPESVHLLKQVGDILKAYPDNEVLIEGHTDSTGGSESNLTLSRLRATQVRDYLIKQGFDAKRFKVVGYGSTQPIADNTTRDGRALNRRVELIILKKAEAK